MKPDLHPKYVKSKVTCACGATWESHSTVGEIHTEICSACHPFYTGKQVLVDTAGQIEKFKRRYEKKATT